MTNYTVELNKLVKYFGRRLIFDGIDYSFQSGHVYGISGPNGSGKSTLVKIIACLISPTKGKIRHSFEGKVIEEEALHNFIGFVSPYLFLYDEFTAEENLQHISKVRGIKFNKERSDFLLNEFNLYERRCDLLRGFSSGMKQRLKFAFALLHEPQLLILDEPTSNLDHSGKEKVYQFIISEGRTKLVLVASNEEADLTLCEKVLELQNFKNLQTRQ
ncbi:MAG: ABC transporter ATP-binding protein [Ignavibacteria bacterium]|nr:ABC transporter ATP-binding protein [Ignavibacteria bacterium]